MMYDEDGQRMVVDDEEEEAGGGGGQRGRRRRDGDRKTKNPQGNVGNNSQLPKFPSQTSPNILKFL